MLESDAAWDMPRRLQQHDRADTVITMNRVTMRNFVRILSMSVIGAALAVYGASCNNQTGFSGSVGNTPNGPKLPSYQILGDTPGTPFTATISDDRSFWTLQGNVPLSIVIVNPPSNNAQLVVTKTTSDNSSLSAEIITGNHIKDVQETSAPFGTVQVQIGRQNTAPAAANPDLRISLLGPLNVRYNALVEDSAIGFIIQARAPTLIVFDTPNGKVDATFFSGGRNFGNFTANMTLNGLVVVPTVAGGPNLTIRQP
jgi:hypothetical protein